MSNPKIPKLHEGDKAPNFIATDVNGNKINLHSIGSQYILLAFFRYSGCPWCNLAIHRLTLEQKHLKENGCTTIAFIQSDRSDIMSNIYDRHQVQPDFSIIADYEKAYYKMYGVTSSIKAVSKSISKIPHWVHAAKKHGFKQTKMDGDLFMVPAVFVINGRTKEITEE